MIDPKSIPEAPTAPAIAFLHHWEPDGLWVLTAIDPETRDIETRTFMSDEADRATAWVEECNRKRRWNVYFQVNRPKHPLTKKAAKDDIGEIVAAHVDVDLRGGRDAAEEARILEDMRTVKPPPTVIVFSGGGYQGYWRFTDPISANEANIRRIETENATIARYLGGDHCHSIDHIMRLPSTINFPDARKQAKGRVIGLAQVVEAYWDRRYPYSDLPTHPELAKLPDWCRTAIETGETENSGGDRSRAVFAVTCELVRSGWADDAIAAVLLDPSLGISAHVRAQSKPGRYVKRQIDRARDATSEDYSRSNNKIVANHQGNIRRALANLKVTVSHDTFADRLLIEGPDGEPRRFLGDAEMAELWLTVDQQCGFRPTKDFFFDVVIDTARANAFHPVRDYLDALDWDGVPRLDQWLVGYAGAADSEYTRAVGRLVLIAAVRRARDPGVKFDEMLVLESAQGTEKSSALEVLAVNPDWFSDALPLNADDKKVIETLAGRWIVEAAELKGMRKGDIEHLKAFLSRRIDRARMSYGRLVTEVPRQCVIIGTTNSDRYLRDSTGNRRFWPIRVERFDLTALRRDRDQLWAEAAQAEAGEEGIRLDPKLYSAAGEVQEDRRIEDPFVGLIESAIGELNGKITVQDVWVIVNVPEGMRTQEHNARLGEAMRELGWERIRSRVGGNKKRYVYARGSETERELWINVNRDMETRQLFVELMDAERQREAEAAAAEAQIPF